MNLVLGIAVLSILGNVVANAVIIGSADRNIDGSYTYNYTVNNTAGSFPVSAFSLEFDFTAAERDWEPVDLLGGGAVITNLGDPLDFFDDWIAGEGVPVTGLWAQDFLAIGPLGEGDIAVGEVLGGFSFISNYGPGLVATTEFSPAGASSQGFTVGPVVPEPSALFLVGAASFLLFRKRRVS